MLSGREIIDSIETAGEIGISPYDRRMVQSASIDVRLSDSGLIRYTKGVTLHAGEPVTGYTWVSYDYTIKPGELVLGTTLENVRIGAYLSAKLEGKSTLGRMGLVVHATAGFVDPGWAGPLTLEISVVGSNPVSLRPGLRIAQLVFFRLGAKAEEYRGHYMGGRVLPDPEALV